MSSEQGHLTHAAPEIVAAAARKVVEAVWSAVDRGAIDARCPIADAALDLRDAIDPNWHPAQSASSEQVDP